MEKLKWHQQIIAQVQAETLSELIEKPGPDLDEFLAKEKILKTRKNATLVRQLPVVPLSFFDRCPPFMKRRLSFPDVSSFESIKGFLKAMIKWVAHRVSVAALKSVTVLSRG